MKDILKFAGTALAAILVFLSVTTTIFFVSQSDTQTGKATGTVIDVYVGGHFTQSCQLRMRYGESFSVVNVSTDPEKCVHLIPLVGKTITVEYHVAPLSETYRKYDSRNILDDYSLVVGNE